MTTQSELNAAWKLRQNNCDQHVIDYRYDMMVEWKDANMHHPDFEIDCCHCCDWCHDPMGDE